MLWIVPGRHCRVAIFRCPLSRAAVILTAHSLCSASSKRSKPRALQDFCKVSKMSSSPPGSPIEAVGWAERAVHAYVQTPQGHGLASTTRSECPLRNRMFSSSATKQGQASRRASGRPVHWIGEDQRPKPIFLHTSQLRRPPPRARGIPYHPQPWILHRG